MTKGNTMTKIATAAMLAAVLLVPTAANAAAPAKRTPPKPAKPQKCKLVQTVGFVVGGTLATVDASSIQVTVLEANAHARNYLTTRPATFATAGARLRLEGVTDADGNGVVGLADAGAGDAVKVVGRLTQPKKGCIGDTRLAISAVEIARAPADPEPVADQPPALEPSVTP